ncbi:MAG: ATP-binding protein [Syntrophaceae bacterium]
MKDFFKRLAFTSIIDSRLERLIPSWKTNLLIPVVIIFVVMGYYVWLISHAQRLFLAQVKSNAQLFSEAVHLNANNALLSQNAIAEIMQSFLGNTARFVDYLDAIDPFTETELSAFCQQTGLSWIVIQRPKGRTEGRGASLMEGLIPAPGEFKTYILKRQRAPGSIVIAFYSPRIQALENQIELKETLKRLKRLSGIAYVRIEKEPAQTPRQHYGVRLIESRRIAETRLGMENDQTLVVGVSAQTYYDERNRLWSQFLSFVVLTMVIGILVSWLLFYYQTKTLNQVRTFERSLARQQEDAALGQASATITHELRNPLNAISMGLQRLRIEADELTPEHQDLIDTMLKAMLRTNGIITNLGRYTKVLKPRLQTVDLHVVIDHLLTLYKGALTERGIAATFIPCPEASLEADQHLLEEMLENLIKNTIEAQPRGGYIHIELKRQQSMLAIELENAGFDLPPETASRIFEPYFTTKTQGSGLGLAIAKRIIEAHGGSISGHIPRAGILHVHILLPQNADRAAGGNEQAI